MKFLTLWYVMMAFRRLLGGDDEQKSAEDEEDDDERANLDVCGLSEVEPASENIDDMLNVMETLHDDAQNISITTTTTTTTTSGLRVAAAVDSESEASAVCSTLTDSDVGQALDAVLQNDIDGLLSTISDDQIDCSSSAVTAASGITADCLLTTSLLPTGSTETDQHYLLYSAHTDELIDTFLRSTDAGNSEAETAVYDELQAVKLTAEDWPVDSLNDDVQMGGMLVEFDSSLLTIIEVENVQTPVDAEACLTVAPGGGVSQVVNGETTSWNIFQGLEVSQFQVVGSEQLTEALTDTDSLPTLEHGEIDDSQRYTTAEGTDGTGSDTSEHSTGSGSNAGSPGDMPTATVKTDFDQLSNSESPITGSDEEYVLIVDCVEGSDPDEMEYEVVDEVDKATDSAVTSHDVGDRPEVRTSDACDDVATNS